MLPSQLGGLHELSFVGRLIDALHAEVAAGAQRPALPVLVPDAGLASGLG